MTQADAISELFRELKSDLALLEGGEEDALKNRLIQHGGEATRIFLVNQNRIADSLEKISESLNRLSKHGFKIKNG